MSTLGHRICAYVFLAALVSGPVFFGLVAHSTEFQQASFVPQTSKEWFNGSFGAKFDRMFKDEFPLKTFSVTAMNALSYQVFGEARKGAVIGKDGWIFSDEEFVWPSDAEKNVSDHLAFIASTAKILEAKGAKLVIAFIPQKASIYPEHLGAVRFPLGQQQLYASVFEVVSKNPGIVLADVHAALVNAKEKSDVFLQTDTHWTVDGATAVAASVTMVFPKLPASANSLFTRSELPKVNHVGDLLKFVNLGTWEFLLPVKSEAITPIKANLANTTVDDFLTDSGAAPERQGIVLVGTSYSANALWSFENELKLQLQQDVVNKAEEGKGFVIPMQNYLKTLDGIRESPEIVIWEVPVRYFAQALHP
jgi:alginate O-acetyltransferase complex protein AlgJ